MSDQDTQDRREGQQEQPRHPVRQLTAEEYQRIQDIKSYLRTVRQADRHVRAAAAAMEHIREQYGTIRAVGYEQHIRSGGHGSATEHQALQIISAEERLETDVREWQRLKDEAAEKISRMSAAAERDVLTLYYLSGMTWESTADILRMDVRTVYRLHGHALQHMAGITG